MITLLKAAGVIVAGSIAIIAALFCLASGLAHGTTDPVERKDALLTGFWGLIVLAICAAVILSLTGCQAAKTIVDICRDGLCR